MTTHRIANEFALIKQDLIRWFTWLFMATKNYC